MRMRPSITATLRLALAALLLMASLPPGAAADRLTLLTDLELSLSENELTSKQTGAVTHTETDRFSQLYTLELDKSLSPFLLFNAGGTFEKNAADTDTDGIGRSTEDRQISPHIGLEWNNPFLRGSIDYRKTELRNDGTGILASRTFTEAYTGSLFWRPSDLPSVNLEYVHARAWDEPVSRDSVNDTLSLSSHYAYRQFIFDYNHSRSENRDELKDRETRIMNNSGAVLFADSFLDDLLSVNAGARVDRSTTEFLGRGERLVRTVPLGAGFFLPSDPFPVDNQPGEFTTVDAAHPFSTLNLGLGGGSGQVSFGLFFSGTVAVDVLRLPLVADPQDPTIATPGQIAGVAAAFAWTLFVSDDQLHWTEVPIAQVVYDPFDHLFEIRPWQTVTADYVKIVTRPLDIGAPGKILLGDVQAFTRLPDDAGTELTSTNQTYNLALGYALSPRTTLGYDTYFQYQSSEPFGSDRSRLSNGLSVQHRFNRIFAGSSRLLRSDAWEDGHKEAANENFSASLRGLYLPTFNQTLTYSLAHARERAGDSFANAIVLRSNLDVYEGFTLSLDQGYSWQTPLEGGDTSSFFLRGRSSVVPHRRLNLDVDYSISWNDEEGQPDGQTQSGRVGGFWLPLDTLSLSSNISFRRAEAGGEIDSRVQREYGIAWSPLLHGTLQFAVAYTESSSSANEESATLSENIRWRLTHYALLTLSHAQGTSETDLLKNRNRSILMDLRIYF